MDWLWGERAFVLPIPLTGTQIPFIKADICNKKDLEQIFNAHHFEAVIHFAGLKAVGESVHKPLSYYQNNISGTLTLLEVMRLHGVKRIVFSSSATVYGEPNCLPIREDFPLSATNPYGRSKLIIEEMLRDIHISDSGWDIAILRYFNPVGAHQSGRIGEYPSGIPSNLMPYIAQVAIGRLAELSVFGNDYPTRDGTGVRDYIHVVDLAKGHVCAVEKLETNPGVVTYNLGTGQGYSVLDMVKAFEKTSGKAVARRIVHRRTGDIAECYADPSLAKVELKWEAKKGLEDMCRDTWRWQSNNPDGYQ